MSVRKDSDPLGFLLERKKEKDVDDQKARASRATSTSKSVAEFDVDAEFRRRGPSDSSEEGSRSICKSSFLGSGSMNMNASSFLSVGSQSAFAAAARQTSVTIASPRPAPEDVSRIQIAIPGAPGSRSGTPRPSADLTVSENKMHVKMSESSEGGKLKDFLPGEKIQMMEKRCFLRSANGVVFRNLHGRLILTNYRLIFRVARVSMYDDLFWAIKGRLFSIPLGTIDEVSADKVDVIDNLPKDAKAVQVHAKDVRTLIFIISPKEQAHKLADSISTLAHSGILSTIFAFRYAEAIWTSDPDSMLEGWSIYDPQLEFGKMGVDTDEMPNPASPWKLSAINKDYSLCPSYPAWLVLPRCSSDEDLRVVATYRRRGRIPTLCWCGGPELSYAALWRCSQPSEGLMKSKCEKDERLLADIRSAGLQNKSEQTPRKLFLIDLRPKTKAYATRAGGGGITDYEGVKLVFGGIENIHHVRDAWKAMGAAALAVSEGEVGSWLKDVADSHWYELIGTLLRCVVWAVRELTQQKSSVLMHCSDGWDRTSQAIALTELCLDASYRTQTGFLKLIHKEFCSFGHLFRTRLALGEKATSEYSPIFIQWLETVYQLLDQFPCEFEFTPALLLRIAEEALSNRYGSFLCDSERERVADVVPFTLSLWSALQTPSSLEMYRNSQYRPSPRTLIPVVSQVRFRVWEAYWFRYHPYGHCQEAPPLAASSDDAQRADEPGTAGNEVEAGGGETNSAGSSRPAPPRVEDQGLLPHDGTQSWSLFDDEFDNASSIGTIKSCAVNKSAVFADESDDDFVNESVVWH